MKPAQFFYYKTVIKGIPHGYKILYSYIYGIKICLWQLREISKCLKWNEKTRSLSMTSDTSVMCLIELRLAMSGYCVVKQSRAWEAVLPLWEAGYRNWYLCIRLWLSQCFNIVIYWYSEVKTWQSEASLMKDLILLYPVYFTWCSFIYHSHDPLTLC